MKDWLSKLTGAERKEWDDWAKNIENDLVPKLESSAMVMSLMPRSGKPDAKFAVELGMAIMLDKPIIVMAEPGQAIPSKLSAIADAVVVADLGTEEGKDTLALAINEFLSKLED
jgi:hypothetical protein